MRKNNETTSDCQLLVAYRTLFIQSPTEFLDADRCNRENFIDAALLLSHEKDRRRKEVMVVSDSETETSGSEGSNDGSVKLQGRVRSGFREEGLRQSATGSRSFTKRDWYDKRDVTYIVQSTGVGPNGTVPDTLFILVEFIRDSR